MQEIVRDTNHKPTYVQKQDHCKVLLERELDVASQKVLQTPKHQPKYSDFSKFTPSTSRANIKDRMSLILEERSPSIRSPVEKQGPCRRKPCTDSSWKQLRSRRMIMARGPAWITGCFNNDESVMGKSRRNKGIVGLPRVQRGLKRKPNNSKRC